MKPIPIMVIIVLFLLFGCFTLKCGNGGTFCASGQCCDDQCVKCSSGSSLGTDCQCHSNTSTCNTSYILGKDNLCHPKCGNGYCTGSAKCYNNQCLTCKAGSYLAADGKCYLINSNNTACTSGNIYGNDSLCHPECGTSGTYCTGNEQCYNNKCLSCQVGFYLGNDGKCYSKSNTPSCNSGYIHGNDGLCHPECGNSGTYCITGDCCGNECLTCSGDSYLGTDCQCHSNTPSCNTGYVYGEDGLCHPECGSGTYCLTGECCGGECLTCSAGYLGTDCECHGQCNSGFIYGNDGLCHPECGNSGTYCITGDCCGNECLTCSGDSYLGTDCQCHSDTPSCDSGYIYAADGLCHPECGSGTYCITGQCCGGQCLYCTGGYLGTDCECH